MPSENLSRAVFQTLAYADVFDYPLTAPEAHRYLTSQKASLAEVTRELADKAIFSQSGDYFTLRGREETVEIRKRRDEIAARLWPKALRYGQLLARLPFVRMVAVTGSLSMNNTEAGGDIDYMIVTAPGHLWTCRALALVVARIARLEGIRLCPNYLVTTSGLELKERSLYVAHEVAQMIPVSGLETYHVFCERNDWIYEYLPNASLPPESPPAVKQLKSRSRLQRAMEMILSLPFGGWLEKWEMSRKIKKLSRQQSSSVESYFSADVCKGHIDQHGESVVSAFAVRLQKST